MVYVCEDWVGLDEENGISWCFFPGNVASMMLVVLLPVYVRESSTLALLHNCSDPHERLGQESKHISFAASPTLPQAWTG